MYAITIKEISANTLKAIKNYLPVEHGKEPNLWEVALILGNYYNTVSLDKEVVTAIRSVISKIREFQGKMAMVKKEPAIIVLGTSGWRGVIGEDYTLFNIHKVLRAITELIQRYHIALHIPFHDSSNVKIERSKN